MTVGNNHWGVDYDMINISTILNIGIIVIQENGVYCISIDKKKKFEYYMYIYNIDNYHYKLAFVDDKCFSKCTELPEWFVEIFNKKCKDNKILCS